MTTANVTALPDKPSDLIELAMADLKKAEADPKYVINMHRWHVPDSEYEVRLHPDGVCHICLAGAVMAYELGIPSDVRMSPDEFEDIGVQLKLDALDHFRCGYIVEGLELMDLDVPNETMEIFPVIPYRDSPTDFAMCMRELIEELRKHDL